MGVSEFVSVVVHGSRPVTTTAIGANWHYDHFRNDRVLKTVRAWLDALSLDFAQATCSRVGVDGRHDASHFAGLRTGDIQLRRSRQSP